MSNRETTVVVTAKRGRFGAGDPLTMPDGFCAEAVNVDFYQAGLCRKRPPIIRNTYGSDPATVIHRMLRFLPNYDDIHPVLFAIEKGAMGGGSDNIKMSNWGGSWQAPTTETAVDDDFTYYASATGCVLNGHLFITGANTVKVWTGSVLRQVGISQPAAGPTCADVAGGTPTKRYYRVAFVDKPSAVTRRGELSVTGPVGGYTPAAGKGARVTKPATPLGGSTHWELYASADDISYYLIATTANATTTYDDLADPAAYAGAQPPVVGDNTVPANWKCIAKDGNRLLGWGSNTTGDKQSRLWYTAVLGESYIGDEERVPLDHYKDVGESDGDFATALSDNIDGAIYLFKKRHVYKLVPTGDVLDPYRIFTLSNKCGCKDPMSLVEGEDEFGNPCLYFTSDVGIYRLGAKGLENITDRVRDLFGANVTPIYYHPERQQVWFKAPDVSKTLVYHVATGAWSTFTGVFATVDCAVAWQEMPGVSSRLGPHVAYHVGTAGRWGYYQDSGVTGWLDEAATSYDSYVLTAPLAPFGLMRHIETSDPQLYAKPSSIGTAATALRVTVFADWVDSGRYADVSLVDATAPSYLIRAAEGARVGGCSVVQFKVGEKPGAQTYPWSVESLSFEVAMKEGL